MEEKMFDVGKIVNTHGIRGEVKVVQLTDFEERFDVGETVYAFKDNQLPTSLVITSQRKHKGFYLLMFEGYDSINNVEIFKNSELKINESQLSELEPGAYYYYEIIGSDVYTVNEEWLGIVKEILAPGANDVFVVKREDKEFLIPNTKNIVKNIDIIQRKIIIEPMEGLLD